MLITDKVIIPSDINNACMDNPPFHSNPMELVTMVVTIPFTLKERMVPRIYPMNNITIN